LGFGEGHGARLQIWGRLRLNQPEAIVISFLTLEQKRTPGADDTAGFKFRRFRGERDGANRGRNVAPISATLAKPYPKSVAVVKDYFPIV
jgi:hypothetical protein